MTSILVPVCWWGNYAPTGEQEEKYGANPYYRVCGRCHGAASDDGRAGLDVSQYRKFWAVQGGADDGLDVCEHCIEAYLGEKGNGPR